MLILNLTLAGWTQYVRADPSRQGRFLKEHWYVVQIQSTQLPFALKKWQCWLPSLLPWRRRAVGSATAQLISLRTVNWRTDTDMHF